MIFRPSFNGHGISVDSCKNKSEHINQKNQVTCSAPVCDEFKNTPDFLPIFSWAKKPVFNLGVP